MSRMFAAPRLGSLSLLSANVSLLLSFAVAPLPAQQIANGSITARAIKSGAGYVGFDLLAGTNRVAEVRLSSPRVQLTAQSCQPQSRGTTLTFEQLAAPSATGLRLDKESAINVTLKPDELFPVVSFDLAIAGFDPAKWTNTIGAQPFHFLTLELREAEAWHQRGWLNATPLVDRFPLLLDPHAGTPEISSYTYNRTWSYTPPLGAHPLPVIGLWAPKSRRYVGMEFQTTRLEDNSERDIATGYHWADTSMESNPSSANQFVALVYPFGSHGYQQLVFPTAGARLKSHGTLLWSTNLPATDDPNRFVWLVLWPQINDRLPAVPEVPDLSWIPGGIRLRNFEGPASGNLIGEVEKPFQVAGSKLVYGWGWHNESPTAVPARRGDTNRLATLEREAQQLVSLAKHFKLPGGEGVFWEKPLIGEWTEQFGGKAVTTLHNANGFAAGRLLLGLYRDCGHQKYLPLIDGVLNWAKEIAWTRNEFADVPSSPFAIGGTLTASFCLEYYMTFKDSSDPARRRQAQTALDLARSFTYRYLVMWPSDNNRDDNLDSSFLWEPNSGRDWTGAACANEVFWNLDTLAQTAVHTGDPVLMWALQGSLSRWHLLYQDVVKDRLEDYQAGDMAEGYGLYDGNIYGTGKRASYGFAASLAMTEPVGNSIVRVLAGEKAALAFRKGAGEAFIKDYRYTPSGNLAFTVASVTNTFDLALTVPYVDISEKRAGVIRQGKKMALSPGHDLIRPHSALWSLYLKGMKPSDRIVIGEPDETSPILPSTPPRGERSVAIAEGHWPNELQNGYELVHLPFDASLDWKWTDPAGWAGLPRGHWWTYGIPFRLERRIGAVAPGAPAQAVSLAHPVRFDRGRKDLAAVFLLYESGPGRAPELTYADGSHSGPGDLLEALAWEAWPPRFTAKLLIGQIKVRPGLAVTGIDPGQRRVWALTTQAGPRPSNTALAQGASEWARLCREQAIIANLHNVILSGPEHRIAIIPPAPTGEQRTLAREVGLSQRAVSLSPEQLIDASFFNHRQLPAAIYLDGEDYVHTVRQDGDAATALKNYVRDGGTLVLLPSLPWPLFYATGPGYHRAEALTEGLGLPLQMAVENAPTEKLTVHLAPGQSLFKIDVADYPLSAGDPRLRTIDRSRLSRGAKYTPLATVLGVSGKNYGDAAGLIEFTGGGRILYVAFNLTSDPEHGSAFSDGALRFLVRAATAP